MVKLEYLTNIMKDLSESELRNYIDNKDQFQHEAVIAAINELEKRELSTDDLSISKDEINSQIVQTNLASQANSSLPKDRNITDDPIAPLLYRDRFILMYGALFSVFAAGILMAINFSKIEKRRLVLPVVLCSLAYTIVQIIILGQIETYSAALSLPVSMLGVYLLQQLFWRKQVDPNLKYRKRPVWGALIIILIIWAPIVYIIVLTGQSGYS